MLEGCLQCKRLARTRFMHEYQFEGWWKNCENIVRPSINVTLHSLTDAGHLSLNRFSSNGRYWGLKVARGDWDWSVTTIDRRAITKSMSERFTLEFQLLYRGYIKHLIHVFPAKRLKAWYSQCLSYGIQQTCGCQGDPCSLWGHGSIWLALPVYFQLLVCALKKVIMWYPHLFRHWKRHSVISRPTMMSFT